MLGLAGFTAEAEEPGSAEEWLKQLEPALEQTSYRGVFVYSRGDSVNVMRIVHHYRDGRVHERLVHQDGTGTEIVRQGNDVVCLFPDEGRLQLDALLPSGPFSKAFRDQLEPMSQWYQAQMRPRDRVAGHQAVVVSLEARDDYRYSHRLWLEESTGLLIKSQVRSHDEEILEHFQFTHLELTRDIKPEELDLPESARERSVSRLEEKGKAAEGANLDWELAWMPKGFEMMPASPTRDGYAVFSDGLVSFSVFVEAEKDVAMPAGMSRIGATTAYLHKFSHDGESYRVAVIGEIPPRTAMQVAQHVMMDGTRIGRMESAAP